MFVSVYLNLTAYMILFSSVHTVSGIIKKAVFFLYNRTRQCNSDSVEEFTNGFVDAKEAMFIKNNKNALVFSVS